MPRMSPADGLPDRRIRLVAHYAAARPRSTRTLDWYVGFGYFKLAVVAEGIHHRYLQGKTVGTGFDHFGAVVPRLLDSALHSLAGRGDPDGLSTQRTLARPCRSRCSVPGRGTSTPAEPTFEPRPRANRAEGSPVPDTPDVLATLKDEARQQGLWNLFLPDDRFGAGLSVLDYAPIAELSGRSVAIAPEAMNCSAPDTGNMELLAMCSVADAARALAAPAARRRDPLLLLDDRAGRRQQRRDQHRDPDRPRRRRLRRQRPQVVVDRRDASRVQGLDRDGRQRSRRRSARPALDDPRSARHAGRHRPALDHGVRLRRRTARRPRCHRLRRRAGARRATCSARRAAAS